MRIFDAAVTLVAAVLGLGFMNWAGWAPVLSWVMPEFPVYLGTALVSLPVGLVAGYFTSEPVARKGLGATILAVFFALILTGVVGFSEETVRQVLVSGISTVSSPLFGAVAFNVVFALFHYGGKGKNNKRAVASAFVLGAVFTGIGIFSLPLAMASHAMFDFGAFLGAVIKGE